MAFFFSIRALDCIIKADLIFDVLDLRLHKPRNADLRFQCHLLCDDLAIITMSLIRYIICFRLKITASSWGVIIQNVDWHFAGVEPVFT